MSSDPTPGAGAATSTGTAAGTSRRVLALLLLIAALGGLGLAALGAAADRGDGPTFVGRSEREYQPPDQHQDYEEAEWATQDEPIRPPEPDGPSTGLLTVLVVLGVIVAALAIWVLYRMRKLARPAPGIAGEADDDDELTPAQARAALGEARTHLSTVVDAHDAVIAAWLALERAIAEAGVRRRPSQTTLEFVVAVLGTLDLDREALDRLAHLYRRALFDAAPLGETDRDEAITMLDRLTAGLDAAAPGAS